MQKRDVKNLEKYFIKDLCEKKNECKNWINTKADKFSMFLFNFILLSVRVISSVSKQRSQM